MTSLEQGDILVAARFCGPPGSANGGYICGLTAGRIAQPVTVRLLRPPPLERAMSLQPVPDGTWAVDCDGQRVIEARPSEPLDPAIPESPGYLQALDAALHGTDLHDHPCPGCFVCGPQRRRGDGLRIFAGPLSGRDEVAAAWLPDASLPQTNGRIAPAIMSAALDCPGFHALRTGPRLWLLGEFSVHIDRLVHVDEPCVIVGWKIAAKGRKAVVGTVLFDEDGEPCAWARGTWIEPRVAQTPAPLSGA
ncbi:MAG TPA: hotdog fold domain-containing protein [Steroidobacteraceae bacterium]|jgi:hypothetical protein|nr:hotdog fold domain-containing protein [Steroidobacteraceae bacterium]